MSHEVPTGADAPSVRLEGVTKRFGDFAAVRDIDLDIRRGEFFSMLGPSGCGKTTTLRMIAGLRAAHRGARSPRRRGRDRAARRTGARPTPSSRATRCFRTCTVEQTSPSGSSAEGRQGRDQAPGERGARARRAGDEAKRKPRAASGGQQQRVALARALVNEPALLLLDEPLGALDLKLRKQLQVELKRIQRDVGITFIYVTHDQEEALTMSDRIAVMNRGVDRAGGRSRGGLRAARDRPSSPASSACRTSCRARSPRPTAAAHSCAWTRDPRSARLSRRREAGRARARGRAPGEARADARRRRRA